MNIQGSTILVLGGWGLVGSAICHKLMEHSPKRLIVSSLKKSEAEDAVNDLRAEYKNCDPNMFVPRWGNIFTRNEWKDTFWGDVIGNGDSRMGAIDDIYSELDKDILAKSALYSMIAEEKPDIVIDCINTATAIAYQDIYGAAHELKMKLQEDNLDREAVEKMMVSSYIPQLIRHVQFLYQGMIDAQTKSYVKVGTSGTGGMGLNIPYTHSEERPSRVLMSKSAVAGAQTLLLFLMARTPNGPMVKEVKPTAAIAWKRIAYDKVMKKGKPISLVDMTMDNAHSVSDTFDFKRSDGIVPNGKDFESVFIDTGENGIFSKGEFQAISSIGQMEIVTPEEIAICVVHEILGGNSGKDVIGALDASSLGPTYRGGSLRHVALKKIEELEKENDIDSIAFELLGPPRLSKLLYEAHLIKKIAGSFEDAMFYRPVDLANESVKLISSNTKLRMEMLSIGLAILLPEGNKYLRGTEVKIPKHLGKDQIHCDQKTIDKWCEEGWVDLRPANFELWQKRLGEIKKQTSMIKEDDTSSRYTYSRDYWDNFNSLDEGKLVGWIFEHEDKGWRFKR
jgi:hypothetical protein